jgi:outer membrane protein assembly factor BamB
MKTCSRPFFSRLAGAVLALASLSSLLICSADARTWTQAATGNKVEAELAGVADGNVTLKLPGGRTATVPLASLSQEDQDWIAAQSSAGSGDVKAGNWPRWRGPEQNNISTDAAADLLKEWPSGGPEKLWTYDQAGLGYSSFIVVDGTLYTVGVRVSDAVAIAIDTESGEEKWSTKFGSDDANGYNAGWGNGTRSTPTFDDGMIYVLGVKGEIACLNAEDGKLEWSKHLIDDFGGQAGGWGFAESPLVDGDLVIVGPGGSDAGIVALDKKSGATKWKADDVKPGKAEYASTLAVTFNGERQYIRFFEKEAVSVAAEDGKVLWRVPWPRGGTAVIPTPIFKDGYLYMCSGYKAGSKLAKIGPDYGVEEIWDEEHEVMSNHHGGVVLIDGHVYGFSDTRDGGLVCQNFMTGERVWAQREMPSMAKGSVFAAGGMLYCLSENDGMMTLVEATTDGFSSKGQFKLEPQSDQRHVKGKIWSHPLVIGGKLYLRDQELIHCYDVSAGGS